MSTQRAVVLQEIGKPLVLIHDRPIPQPGPAQIQVKVKVAALNPHDQKIRDLGLLIRSPSMLPWICASDIVGTVSALGNNATGPFELGDRVMYYGSVTAQSTQSGLQEFALADVRSTICKVPDGMSDDEAATIPLNLTTVFVALFVMLGIKVPWLVEEGEVPESLLVVGGGSNCGRFAVQLAKLAGVGTIIAVGGKEAELKGLGATHVLDRHADEASIVQRVKDITDDDLLFVLDTVNLPTGLTLGFNALASRKKGKLARLLPRGVIGDDVKKGHELSEIVAGAGARDPLSLDMWERLPRWIENGDIKPTKYSAAGGLTAEAVNKALDKYREGRSEGQPHIHIS